VFVQEGIAAHSKNQVECHQATTFGLTNFDETSICGTLQRLLTNGLYFEPSISKYGLGAFTEILIELELHGMVPNPTSTNRSRDISAP